MIVIVTIVSTIIRLFGVASRTSSRRSPQRDEASLRSKELFRFVNEINIKTIMIMKIILKLVILLYKLRNEQEMNKQEIRNHTELYGLNKQRTTTE